MIRLIVQNLNATGQTGARTDPLGRSELLSSFRAVGKSNQDLTSGNGPNVTCHWLLFGLNQARESGNPGVCRGSRFRILVTLNRIDFLVAPWLPPSLWAGGIFLRFAPLPSAFLGPTQIFSLALKLQKPDQPETWTVLRSLKRVAGSLFQGGQVYRDQVSEGLT